MNKQKHIRNTRSGGFTLIELMTVMVIIGLLAAVVLAALQQSRAQGRDASRIQALKELQKAIELHFSEYGYFPPISNTNAGRSRDAIEVTCVDGRTGNQGWCDLLAAIAPYYKGGIDDPIDTGNYRYWYDADGTQPQRYGLMTILETSKYDSLSNSDGGYYCQNAGSPGCVTSGIRGYEIGEAPRVCGASNWTNDAC
jgi:prepilin-type N-terminal cleavage/methylation domain-containing protein